jgi:hypothetical protein
MNSSGSAASSVAHPKCHMSLFFPAHGHSDTAERAGGNVGYLVRLNMYTARAGRSLGWWCSCIPLVSARLERRLQAVVPADAIPSSQTPCPFLAFQTVTSHRWCGRIIVTKEGTESTVLFPRRSLMARGYSRCPRRIFVACQDTLSQTRKYTI